MPESPSKNQWPCLAVSGFEELEDVKPIPFEQCNAGIIGDPTFVEETLSALEQKGLRLATLGLGEHTAADLPELVRMLCRPRTVLVRHETAKTLEASLNQLIPLLDENDVIVDCGDSNFKETTARGRRLAERGVGLMALGVGGFSQMECGAAVLMAGGRRESYDRTFPLWQRWAANTNGRSALGYFGSASAAHFLKMVHRAIDLTLMQLVREATEMARQLPDFGPSSATGAEAKLRAFRTEIFGQGCGEKEIAQRLEAVKNTPFARWCAQASRELGVPTPTIDVALGTQSYSAHGRQQELLATPFRKPIGRFANDTASVAAEIDAALHSAMIITYAEGMALLATASERYGFQFDLAEVARVWRGCCRMRAPLLDQIAVAIRGTPHLHNLLFDDDLAEEVMAGQEFLRHAVWRASEIGIDAFAMLASLDYLDSHREAWLPVNLIQPTQDIPASTLEADENASPWESSTAQFG